MRSLKSGIFGCVVAGLLGTFVVVGCSASGDTGDIEPITNTDPTEGDEDTNKGSVLPPSNPSDDDDDEDDSNTGKKDAGKKDAGKTDAGKDAGPPSPEPGDSCTPADEYKTASRSCGMCGKQEALCEPVNGVLKWSEYGPCTGEKGTCIPGSTQACGNCGTQTCSAYCGWGTCTGQPANSCSPGTVQYTNAGCPGGGYKNRTCSATCSWDGYSGTCDIPTTPNKMTIQTTVGAIRSQQWSLNTETTPKPPFSCTGSITTSAVRFVPVEVTNTTTRVAEISAYHTKSTTGRAFDTVIWYYAGSALPMTDADRVACVGTVVDGCSLSGSVCGGSSLAGVEKITIPAGGKVLIYSAPYSSFTDVGDGTLMLNLRTDKLQ